MLRTELLEIIASGENSGVEFKRDDVTLEKVAKEMAAFLNLEGGYILLGVEDDGSVSGLTRGSANAEEWVMEASRTHLRPAVIPYWETIELEPGKLVGIISLSADAPDKPYKSQAGFSVGHENSCWHHNSRAATNEEEMRLYHQSGRLQYDRKPVPGATSAHFDQRRLINYFRDIRGQEFPAERNDDDWSRLNGVEEWQRLLINTEIMTEDRGRAIPSVAGMILFGSNT